MAGIDQTRQFVPLKIAVLTVSDTRALADDKSGATLVERIEKAGHAVADRAIVTDDVEKIRARVKAWIADPVIDVIITTGGTGFTGRDVTPEALEPLFDRPLPGFGERFRALSERQVGSAAWLSRASAGIAAGRLLVILPGSTNAVELALKRLVLPELVHVLRLLKRPSFQE
jgi:molybdenum cofactor biosynthesis protein B